MVTKDVVMVTDDTPSGGTDVDIQLLEAAKAGDLEVVKVKHNNQSYSFDTRLGVGRVDATTKRKLGSGGPVYKVPCQQLLGYLSNQ